MAVKIHDPKNISEMSIEAVRKRCQYMIDKAKELAANIKKLHVSISKSGNTKTGKLVSTVSMRPMVDCINCKQCSRLCYDMRNDCWRPGVMDSRAKNAAIFIHDPKRYFDEISSYCKRRVKSKPGSAFRWHAGGDIVTMTYFKGMVRVAEENPEMIFLAFTKAFRIVNKYLDNGGVIPDNLQIIFSGWKGLRMYNPYNFPTSHPVFADGSTTAPKDAVLCSGDCSECLVNSDKCWTLKKGESVKFNAH